MITIGPEVAVGPNSSMLEGAIEVEVVVGRAVVVRSLRIRERFVRFRVVGTEETVGLKSII